MSRSSASKIKPSAEAQLENPCVRNCCLDQDDICLGCFRSLEEILGWRKMTKAGRIATLEKCEQRRQKRHLSK